MPYSRHFLIALALILLAAGTASAQGLFSDVAQNQPPLTQQDVEVYISIASAKTDEAKGRAMMGSGLSDERLFFVAAKVGLGLDQLKIKGAPGFDAETFAGLEPNPEELKLIEKNKRKLNSPGQR